MYYSTICIHEVEVHLRHLFVSLILFVVFSANKGHVPAQDPPTKTPPSMRLALDGDCCVSLFEMQAYVKGEDIFSSQWRGLRYLFLSEEEKVVFDANPEKYALAFGGLDVVATYGIEGPIEGVKKVYGSGHNTHRFEDQTFHFANQENFRRFTRNAEQYVLRARQAAYLQAETKRGKTLSDLYPTK